jgi:hypothetical protein
MDSRRRVSILIALVVLAFVLVACDSGYSGQVAYSTPRPPSALELAARETAIAQETREALAEVARATADALELEKRATQQALDLNATQRAQEAQSTRQAWEFARTQEAASIQATATAEARIATATCQALDATATAEHAQATATAVQWAANVQGTQAAAEARAIRATAQAIDRAEERERITQPLRAWWLWVLLALAIPALAILGWRFAKVIEARGRVVRPKPDEGEPFVLLEQTDKDGNRRIALPLRSFNALLDTGDVPALPAPEMQERATMRQQAANALQARQVAATVKARKAHKRKPPQIVAQPVQALPRPRAQAKRQVPGLIKIVSVGSLEEAAAQGILPPRLVETIESEWSETDKED